MRWKTDRDPGIVVKVVDDTAWSDTAVALRRIAETLEKFGGYLPARASTSS